jgi:hypothetical protein
VAGLIAAVIGTIVGAIFGGAMLASVIAADPTGQAEAALGGLVGGSAFSLIGFFFNIVLYPLFGAIGGAAYASIAKPPASKVG